MLAVTLVRKKGVLKEEYGKIVFNGTSFEYNGLSDIFKCYLEKGIMDSENRIFTPSDGIAFLKCLKYKFSSDLLRASDIEQL